VVTGDAVEIRLDCLPQSEFEDGLQVLKAALQGTERPMIVTLRPENEGGQRDLDAVTRKRFWESHADSLKGALIDVELDLVQHFSNSPPPLWRWGRVICSHHDFDGLPGGLPKIYERMARTPARVLKLAFQANDITDCLGVFDLLARASVDGRELIAIAMGTAGICTRILGPSRGAFLTYGALAAERGTAPGQPTARELREVYRINEINRDTMITGLVGLPVGHSLSPHIHNAAFAALQMNAVYMPLEVHDVSAFMRRMVHTRTRELDWNLRGLSVTAPHKAAVMEYLDWTEQAAREIGAVNTVVVEDAALHGYNTDAIAVLQPVIEKLGSLSGARCGIIGAGGAASAVLWSLRNVGANATLFARHEEAGQALANKFGARFERLEDAQWQGFDLVINATPLGTRGPLESFTVATAVQLRGARLAYDLVYNPGETQFMREARAAGCDAIGGLSMLVLQAAEQFRLWTRCEPPLAVMREAAMSTLSAPGS
jgi:shikimate dehydrogenase/3-dehydroquinate dehydratase type I